MGLSDHDEGDGEDGDVRGQTLAERRLKGSGGGGVGRGGIAHHPNLPATTLDAAVGVNGFGSGSGAGASAGGGNGDAAGDASVAKDGTGMRIGMEEGGDDNSMKVYPAAGGRTDSAEKNGDRGQDSDGGERPNSAAGMMRWDEESGRMRLDG